MRRHLLIAPAFALAAAVFATGSADAHGPAPVALSVLTLDMSGAGDVHTNIGLAHANGDGTYAYVCPSRWDGNERALAYAAGDTLLVQSLGVAYLSHDDGCSFEDAGVEGYVVAVTPFGDGFAALYDDDDTDERFVGVVGEGALPLSLPAEPDGLRADGEDLWIAGAGPPLFAARWDGTALEVVLQTEASAISRAVPVAADGDAVWLATGGEQLALTRADATGLSEPRVFQRARHGPIAHDGRWLALFDGTLHEWAEAEWRALEATDWTCLESRGERSFACSLEGTFELGSGDAATRFFSMRQIGPPVTCGADPDECEREWAHFGGESGWLETNPAIDPSSARREPGCAAAPGRGGMAGLWALLGLLSLRAARRPRSGRGWWRARRPARRRARRGAQPATGHRCPRRT